MTKKVSLYNKKRAVNFCDEAIKIINIFLLSVFSPEYLKL